MTAINYLDGLPSISVSAASENPRAGVWRAVPSGHARNGGSFYFADPYWWDGTYPNGVRIDWLLQNAAPASWSVCLWKDEAASEGVFFKIETRNDWLVSVSTDYTGVGTTINDGRTRLRIGTISGTTETVVVERYFDTLPNSSGGVSEDSNFTSGSALFSVTRTTSGYTASVYGPRRHVALSFPCASVFTADPKLLTVSWLWSSPPANVPPAPFYVRPTRLGPDLGQFTLAPTGPLAYDLRFSDRGKPHGPEANASFLNHIEIDRDAPATAQQRYQSELAEVGAYASAGNRALPYLPVGSVATTLALTVEPTSALRNRPPNSNQRNSARLDSLPARTLRVPFDGNAIKSFGTRFFFPAQAADVSSANYLPDDPVPPFIGSSSATTQRALTEYPAWSELSAGSQALISRERPDPQGQLNWENYLASQQALFSKLRDLYEEWHDPSSTRTVFDWPMAIGFFPTTGFVQYLRDYSYTSGNTAAAWVNLSPRWRQRQVVDVSTKSLATHTSEGFRTGSPTNLARWYADGCEEIIVRNFGPGREKYTSIRYFPVLPEVYVESTLSIGGGLFGGFSAPLTLANGRTRFQFYYVDALGPRDPTAPRVLEKTALNVNVDGVMPYSEDIVLRVERIPAAAYSALIKSGSATYSTTATVFVELFGQSLFAGECDVSVTLAFE